VSATTRFSSDRKLREIITIVVTDDAQLILDENSTDRSLSLSVERI